MSAEPFTPHWQQCLGNARCQRCGSFVELTWRWFSEPATWTLCYCDECVTQLVQDEPA